MAPELPGFCTCNRQQTLVLLPTCSAYLWKRIASPFLGLTANAYLAQLEKAGLMPLGAGTLGKTCGHGARSGAACCVQPLLPQLCYPAGCVHAS